MSDDKLNKWFFPHANRLARNLGMPEWKGRIPILVEDAWNFQNEKIKQLEQENAKLKEKMSARRTELRYAYPTIQKLEQENAKLKERLKEACEKCAYNEKYKEMFYSQNIRLKDAMSILSELNNDFDSMEHSYVGKNSDYHKRIKTFLQGAS